MSEKTFYITTPIYYVNGEPHVGSATTTLLVDAVARFHRMRGEAVFFLTGTDEHAQKVADAAAKAGQSPQQFVDNVSQRFVECWRFLDIEYDDFIRTSEPRHKAVVSGVFQTLREKGDIYAGTYEGWYSVSDETFLRDSEVKDGRAIDSGAAVTRVTEQNYYFKLSAYGPALEEYILAHPHFLLPDTRRNEVLSFIKSGLRDIAVSRPNSGWGIEVPGDAAQVVYVWFDAVLNYLTATGWPASPTWADVWPANVHLVGKEIYTRFHATLWPAMLLALGLPLPETVLGHGWWLIGGEKGSKSKGNIPTPQAVVAELQTLSGATEAACVDALRYYLLKDISYTGDSEFSLQNLVARYNADLCNDLGNLLNRTLNMTRQYLNSVVPDGAAGRTANGLFAGLCHVNVLLMETAMLVPDPGAALRYAMRLAIDANKEIENAAPWKKHKAGDITGVEDALYNALEACRLSAVLLAPFLPHTAQAIREQLGLGAVPLQTWQTETRWGKLSAGTVVNAAVPLFPRIDLTKLAAKGENTMTEPETVPDYITIDDFARVQLRVGIIKEAERIPKADKLLRLMVDVGEGQPRQILAGIAENHEPETLIGKRVTVIVNLAPRTMRGLVSQGMLLAATDDEGRAILLHPENDTPSPGAIVR